MATEPWYAYEPYGTHYDTIRRITPRDLDLFHAALELARNSEAHYKHGAVIARGRRILSMRVNKLTTHPILQRYRQHTISLHAEASAIIHARAGIAGTTLYSARVSLTGSASNSKPCLFCMQLMQESGITSVVFFENGDVIKRRIAQ